ncbi:Bidirectional sugar transporter SWEET1 [Cardamine amara subsp. amara]|uniref:Bidirectional sugar transporter SWEET n=1 Tax=Cardamine amara subsp. amara TaxID=228776 RepID=A0ABD1AN19_CARAN
MNIAHTIFGVFGNPFSQSLSLSFIFFFLHETSLKTIVFCRFSTFTGNATALFLFLAPSITFKRVIKNKSTEQFSGIPYPMTLLNCLLSAWYGLPFVSKDNTLVSTINGTGAVIETVYVLIFLFYAPRKEKAKIFATVFSIIMYGSPLSIMRLVIKTKSVEFMPFFLSLFVFLCGTSWFIYGLIGRDPFVAIPNGFGCALGTLQLILYFIYCGNKGEKKSGDAEKNEKSMEMKGDEKSMEMKSDEKQNVVNGKQDLQV